MYTRGKWIHLHTPDSKVEEGKAHSVLRAGDAPVFPPGAVSKDGRYPYPPHTSQREWEKAFTGFLSAGNVWNLSSNGQVKVWDHSPGSLVEEELIELSWAVDAD